MRWQGVGGSGRINGMNWVWQVMRLGALCAVARAGLAAAQTPAPPEPAGAAPVLTLGTPMLRSTMDRMSMAWLFPEKLPDFRLKMDRPEWGPLSAAGMEERLRGVEIRLPMEGFWVGYEKAAEGEEPRATFSIQRGF